MPSTTQTAAATFARYAPVQMPAGPILIASDVSSDSDAAFPLAQVLALRTRADVQIVSVLPPIALPMYGFEGVPLPAPADDATQRERVAAAHAQQSRLVATDTEWPVTIRTGEPAHEIAEAARAVRSRVIVVGRSHHGALQRLLGGDTVLRLLQVGDTPVLAAEPTLTYLPRRVVIATDFSAFSQYAAQVALSLVARDATVTLAHMEPWFERPQRDSDPDLAVSYREDAKRSFERMHAQLARPGLVIDDVLLEGRGTNELINFLRTSGADLVVSATHGYGFMRRMVLGSVAARLIHESPCSILCVPGSAHTLAEARGRTMANAQTIRIEPPRFDAELRAFSERNLGRPCTVEIDQPALGAQRLGHSLPLVGATYDGRDNAVSLMFGTSQLAGQHLTHNIDSISGIEIAADGEGHDQVLRIGHGGGYTLVMLE